MDFEYTQKVSKIGLLSFTPCSVSMAVVYCKCIVVRVLVRNMLRSPLNLITHH